MYIKDYSRQTYVKIEDDYKYISIGWLGRKIHNTTKIRKGVLGKLKICKIHQRVKEDSFLGLHTCGICKKFQEGGSFWIRKSQTERWHIPNMIFHYIKEHNYGLGPEVQKSIMESNIQKIIPIIDIEIDEIIRSVGYEPIGVKGKTFIVRKNTKPDMSFEDLQFLFGRKIKLA